MGGGAEFTGIFELELVLEGSLLEATRVSSWSPWQIWKRWDSWSFWWAECCCESIHLGVLGEDGNVVVPNSLGGVVRGNFSIICGGEILTGFVD